MRSIILSLLTLSLFILFNPWHITTINKLLDINNNIIFPFITLCPTFLYGSLIIPTVHKRNYALPPSRRDINNESKRKTNQPKSLRKRIPCPLGVSCIYGITHMSRPRANNDNVCPYLRYRPYYHKRRAITNQVQRINEYDLSFLFCDIFLCYKYCYARVNEGRQRARGQIYL